MLNSTSMAIARQTYVNNFDISWHSCNLLPIKDRSRISRSPYSVLERDRYTGR
ncbi:MAG: hypothetical protein AAFX78_15865 [Cyanobacteria bacterium J06638_20]